MRWPQRQSGLGSHRPSSIDDLQTLLARQLYVTDRGLATSIYLAQRGIRTANIPIVPGIPLPQKLADLKGPLIVGLIAILAIWVALT